MSLLPVFAPSYTPLHVSVADDWEGSVKGAYSIGTGTMQPDGTDSGLRVVDGHKFAGDFEVTFTWTAIGGEAGWGVYLASEDATFDATLSWGALNDMTANWWFANGSQWRYGGASQASVTFSDADTTGIKRVGSTFYGYKNGSIDHTWSQTNSGEVRLVWGCGDPSTPIAGDFQWTGGG